MKALVFAAGLGTRLRPITDHMPKALVPVAGVPMLERVIMKLASQGCDSFVVNVHHFGEQIIDYLQVNNGFGCNVRISDERGQLLETGGGLLYAFDNGNIQTEPVLVCNVDILSNINLVDLIAAHVNSPKLLATVVVSERETQRYLLFDRNGELCGWTNKNTGEVKPEVLRDNASEIDNLKMLAFSGMQIVEPSFFAELQQTRAEKGEKFSLIDTYLSIVSRQAGVIRAYVPQQYKMMDVGKIDQLGEAERINAETYGIDEIPVVLNMIPPIRYAPHIQRMSLA